MNTYFIITNILLMILHGRRVLYEMPFGLFLVRLLVGVGLDGGVFYYRHPQAQSMEGLFVVRFQMLLFFYLCLVMIFFACFSFFFPLLF